MLSNYPTSGVITKYFYSSKTGSSFNSSSISPSQKELTSSRVSLSPQSQATAIVVSPNPEDFAKLVQAYYDYHQGKLSTSVTHTATSPLFRFSHCATSSNFVAEITEHLHQTGSVAPDYDFQSPNQAIDGTLKASVLVVDGSPFKNDWSKAYQEVVVPLLASTFLRKWPILWLLDESQQDEFESTHSESAYRSFDEWANGQASNYQEAMMPMAFFYPASQKPRLFHARLEALLRVYQGRIKREYELRLQQEAEHELLLTVSNLENNTQDALISVDPDYLITSWNKGAERIYGWTTKEAVGQSISFIRYDGPLSVEEEEMQAANPEYLPWKGNVNHWAGSVIQKNRAGQKLLIQSTVSAVRDRQGQLVELVGVNRDMTIQKKKEAELAEANAFLESIIEQSPIGIMVYDKDGLCIQLNSAFERILGIADRLMLVGHYNILTDPFAGESNIAELVRPAFAGTVVTLPFQEYNLAIVDANYGVSHSKVVLNAKYFPLFNLANQLQNVVVLVEDVTDERNLERQLLQAQKMEVVGSLAGTIAHDFNNLLSVYTLSLDSLKIELHKQFEIIPELLDEFNDLETITAQARELISQLLVFTRSGQRPDQHLDLISLGELVNTSSTLLKKVVGDNIKLQYTHNSGLAQVEASSGQLMQLLMNFVVNARDALLEKQSRLSADMLNSNLWQPALAISTFQKLFDTLPRTGFQPVPASNTSRQHFVIRSSNESTTPHYVGLSVKDNGDGISPNTLEHIFEPLFTTKGIGKGTGLGLASCYAIARNYGGWIEVETELGVATCFTLFLPVSAKDGSNDGNGNPFAPIELSNPSFERKYLSTPKTALPTLLLVEDDTILRMTMARFFENNDWKGIVAENGLAALQSYYETKLYEVEMVITDSVMPGLSGPELLTQLHGTNPYLSMILMSGGFVGNGNDIIQVTELMRNKNIRFLSKPFKLDEAK